MVGPAEVETQDDDNYLPPAPWEMDALVQKRNFQSFPHPSPRNYVTGEVYFISDGDCIKIGYSGSALVRFRDIQIGSSRELRLLGYTPGTMDDEQRLHRMFNHIHVRGEWFKATPRLLEFVAAACAPGGCLPKADPSNSGTRRALTIWSRRQREPIRNLAWTVRAQLLMLTRCPRSNALRMCVAQSTERLRAAA